MTRKLRQIAAGSPNHFVTRGNNRRRLFSYRDDYPLFLRLVAKALDEFECRLHALCLMTNHVHLLVTPPTVDAASDFVKAFSQRYAQIRNKKLNATGKLFEQRFFSEPITTVVQLARTTMYIEANPIRAGRGSNAAQYLWSTHRLHIGDPSTKVWPGIWTPSAWYQSFGADEQECSREYELAFAEYLRLDLRPDHADDLIEIEALSASQYRRRLRRPDGTSAAE